MVMLSGVRGGGGGATPLVTGLLGVLNMRSVKEKVPLSTVSNLNLRSSFHAAVSISSSFPAIYNWSSWTPSEARNQAILFQPTLPATARHLVEPTCFHHAPRHCAKRQPVINTL